MGRHKTRYFFRSTPLFVICDNCSLRRAKTFGNHYLVYTNILSRTTVKVKKTRVNYVCLYENIVGCMKYICYNKLYPGGVFIE